ncbi:hypothetical protein chiPu_0009576 [Chiloscyllium punctatum]|uniref:Uncharacterized protein n=1 Tax=Chiloscyllium punctatum TaxID=137246 RepID=A0A401SL57_CHIPU|nr:hypothetical protein [Chiloscyllium punctatum]
MAELELGGAAVFWVLAVERYLPDRPGANGYDVTLYGQGDEDRGPLKYSLSPQLNRLVETNRLCSGRQLRLSRWSMLSDGLRVIDRAEVLRGAIPPPACFAFLPVPRPSHCHAKYYLPLWEDSDYYGEEWIMQTHSQEFVNLEGVVCHCYLKSKTCELWF